jgi:DNA primase
MEYIAKRKLTLDDYDFYWSPEAGYRDRLIIPFTYQSKIVGYTARKVVESKVKYLSEQQPGYVFNTDAQDDDRKYIVAVEGPIDAIAIDGVALLGSEVKDQQTALVNSLGKHVIVVPDRDEAGQKLVYDAMESGWSVSMPEWSQDIGDVNDAVCKYGRLHTLYTIIKNAEDSQLKTKLRMKKWFA